MTYFKAAFMERSAIVGDQLELRVKTEDLGDANQGGVRLFDDEGHTLDVPAEVFVCKRGDDDVFKTSIPLAKLRALGFNLKTTQTTGYVDVPGTMRIWETRNHKLVEQKANTVIDLGFGDQRSALSRGVDLFSGSLSADMIVQRGTGGAYMGSWQFAVTGLTFKDKTGFFKGANTINVELYPVHTVSVARENGEEERKGVESLDAMAVVTLRLQADGTYAAKAGDNQAFFSALSEEGIAADKLTAIKVAVRDPVNGDEDSRFGQYYDLL